MPIQPTASPTAQHLVPPPSRPRGRLSGFINAAIALISLLGIFFLGTSLLTGSSFLLAGSSAQAHVGSPGAATAFQGFHDLWLRKWGDHQFTQPDSLHIMTSEANDYHMNAVAIDVTADQNTTTSTTLSYNSADSGNVDSLSDQDIERAITDAQAAGLTPILTLQMQVTNDPITNLPSFIGNLWYKVPGEKPLGVGGSPVGQTEHQWFDSYTAYAVHYAQLSQKYHLPYFIFGNDLVNITTDTNETGPGTYGASGANGETFKCNGRRDCQWRHVINAIKSASYTDYQGNKQTGGGYTGKLIYGASWNSADNAAIEFEHITWWDAVDFIGVSGYFPLLKTAADSPVQTLIDAWHGKQDDLDLAGQGDIIGRLNAVVQQYKHPLLFTEAGYESVAGSNNAPGQSAPTTPVPPDNLEQGNDMEALLRAFTPQVAPWFVGVIWSSDEPKWPRSSVQGWATSTSWAGDTITGNGPNDAKPGGKFLAQFYQQRPVSEK
jgi:hypothetical protein